MTIITVLNVLYVLVAIAMIALILMQSGAGAQAGSGFGAGASATVFGARGASNFLTRMTRWLAILFIGLCLGMGWVITHRAIGPAPAQLGVMEQHADEAAAAPAASDSEVPAAPAGEAVPVRSGASDVPSAPPPMIAAPETGRDVPAAPAVNVGEKVDEKKDPPNR
jgi:preprotein translocase subunit SecG